MNIRMNGRARLNESSYSSSK